MSDITREVYSEAASRAVTLHERLGRWTVYPYYEVRGEREGYAVAPRNVPAERVRRVGSERGRGVYVAEAVYSPANDPHPEGWRRVRYSPKVAAKRFLNVGDWYWPLRDHPDLFARFARLGDEGEIGREEWLRWLHEYGVLGVMPIRTGRYQRNETTDSFSRFVHEALLANRALKLFEAITADQSGSDVETISQLLPEDVGDDPDQAERAALWAIQDVVKQKVHSECYEHLKPRDDGAWRKRNMSPFAREWGFSSLLGAMWLQFSWLVSMDGLRYCQAPNCNNFISPYARPDKDTCSDRCRKAKSRTT
jgi:hypothetical protein